MTKKNKREFEYTLQSNIGIHKDGEKQFCNKIVLKAPNSKQTEQRVMLKQAFMSAMEKSSSAKDSASKGKDRTFDISECEQIISLIYMNLTSKEIIDLFDAFKDLLITGCGKALEMALTAFAIDQIDSEDLDNMMGEFIVNFLIPSWMRAAMKK